MKKTYIAPETNVNVIISQTVFMGGSLGDLEKGDEGVDVDGAATREYEFGEDVLPDDIW